MLVCSFAKYIEVELSKSLNNNYEKYESSHSNYLTESQLRNLLQKKISNGLTKFQDCLENLQWLNVYQ